MLPPFECCLLNSILHDDFNMGYYFCPHRVAHFILQSIISKLLSNSELPLSFDIEEDTQNLIKFANVKINTETKSICEKALIYMDVIRDLGLAKYFIFVNLFSFVSDEDRLKLYEEICYKKYNVLFLENMFREKISYKEKYLLRDKDLCLVINDYCEKS